MQRFIYQYNGNERLQDVEDDLTGGREMPSIGSLINRNGRDWKVVHVVAPVSAGGTIPVVRMFLTDITGIKGHISRPKHLPK